ncbi:MAG: hypothetical protein KGS49_11175 [Planctomycetes bacterium]|nr:hypothetical protein [Planctomycetota bacterium]
MPGTLAWSIGWLAFPQQRIGGGAQGARHSGLVPQQRIGGGARGARHSGLVSWFASISAAADRRQCQRCQVPKVPGTLAWSVGWLAFPQQRIGGGARGARHSGLVHWLASIPATADRRKS